MDKCIKWAILGTSPISETMAKAILAAENSELIAVASRTYEKAQNFASKHSVPFIGKNCCEILEHPEVDVVYIGLPNHLHKTWIINCAHAGKHILCEKPLVLNLQEANEILEILNRKHVFCMEALMYRCHPFIKKIQQIIQEKIIGDVNFFQAFYSANISTIANPIAGGSIRNLGCYPVSLVRLLAGEEPIAVTALGTIGDNNSDQTASLLLKFKNNSIALIGTADNLEMSWNFSLIGSKGKMEVLTNPWLPTFENEIKLSLYGQPSISVKVAAKKPLYTYQIELVSNSILQNKKEAEEGMSWKDSVGNIKILEQWRDAICQELPMSASNW